ncbi:MAG: hypothetical protein A3J75_07270 [Acidobacteria bacterium RBG_16_68_9]|nr:MAG: hypothetical protein A3J75_07270 [Acidobacteria bacterium RBG_16_68_9]
MRDTQLLVEMERKQRDALLSRRTELWKLAYRGFLRDGRGIIVADGSEAPYASDVPVSWRPGSPMLSSSADALQWVKQTAETLRRYNPENEFVLEYRSPQFRVSTYRVRGNDRAVELRRSAQPMR